MSECLWHDCTNEARIKYCSNSCGSKYRTDQRRKWLKAKCVEYKGGECQKCGYNKSNSALEFHHKNATTKKFNISQVLTRSFKNIKVELDKCDLLCANCHREIHENNP